MRQLILLLGSLIALAGCSSSVDVVQTGVNTYSIRKESRTVVLGIDGLKESAVREATSYCARYSSTADVVSEVDSRPPYIAGTASWVEIGFQCVPWQ